MHILTEIHHQQEINIAGRTIHRTSIRGVALRGRELLMVHSSAFGDYKFPGGGLEEGETHSEALAREIGEECGMRLAGFGRAIGAVVEYKFPVELEYDVFRITSHYYLCAVEEGDGIQRLEDYEARRALRPAWIDLETAIRLNKALLPSPLAPNWLRREIFILEYLLLNVLDS